MYDRLIYTDSECVGALIACFCSAEHFAPCHHPTLPRSPPLPPPENRHRRHSRLLAQTALLLQPAHCASAFDKDLPQNARNGISAR